MTIDPQRAQALFLAALELSDSDARREMLNRECNQDNALRQRVEDLLSAHDATGGFEFQPSAPALESTFDAPAMVQPGSLIAGRYMLRQQIGEGGMGTVWLADQTEPVKRKVAVKLIRVERGQSKTILARFEAERQAIALMDHPHIAKLLDAGTTADGAPFFVMELVKGIPLNDFCDQHRLTVPERLSLFMQICSAVQHAHQKGIIHRDLKPSNLLVESHDGKPVPKVIDFGLAKATTGLQLGEHSVFTAFGSIMGTPLYMAPEQASFNAVDVDTRADVYALGVILYELLTGTTPITQETMKKAALDEMLRLIREQDPPTPSSRLSSAENTPSVAASRQVEPQKLGRFVKGELDWIVLKALSKDRDIRYETANGFASDIERFLNHEPVQAGPPSANYRLQKFVRRNRPQVIAAGLILLALIAGIVGTSVGLYQATVAMEESNRNLSFAKKGNEILGSVFAGLDQSEENYKNLSELSEMLLGNLRKAVNELDTSAIGDPVEVAAMQNTLGMSLLGLGDSKLATEVLKKATDTHNAELGPDHPGTMASMNNLGLGYLKSGKLDQALPLFKETLELRKATLGPDHRDTLVSMNNLGLSYQNSGKLDEALSLFEETLKLRKATLEPDHVDILTSMNNLALCYRAVGKQQAIPLFEETLTLMKARLGTDHAKTLTVMNNLAVCYSETGQWAKSLPLQELNLKLIKAKLGPDHPDTLRSMSNLAMNYQQAGKLDLALPLHKEALDLKKVILGPDHPETLASMSNLGIGYQATGKLDQALTLAEEVLALRKSKLGPDHRDTLVSMNNLAMSYQAVGNLDKALPLLEETLKLLTSKLGPDHPETITAKSNLAGVYRAADKMDLALPMLEEILQLHKASLGPDHPDTLSSMNALAVGYEKAGKIDQAVSLHEETLKLRKAQFGPDHLDTLVSMSNLAMSYRFAGKHEPSLALLEEAFPLFKDKLGADHPKTLSCMGNLASALGIAGRLDESLRLREETLSLIKTKLGPDHPEVLICMSNMGATYLDAGRLEEALPLLEESFTRIKSKLGPEHSHTLALMNSLAKGYEATKLIDKAELLHRERLAIVKTKSGGDSPAYASVLAVLGKNLQLQNKWLDSESVLRECLAIREKTKPDDWTTFNTQALLAGALLGQQKYDEAEPLLLKGYEGMVAREKSIPSSVTPISEALDQLIKFYTATNREDEMKRYQDLRSKYPSL